ncbi:LysM peptidoglycan-binding domain-containing protein [candidate division WOR-3 bacterium]|nr:LysM peptidoglycan-binding domain-containing protein [candidate division WOR-3 bacterium]
MRKLLTIILIFVFVFTILTAKTHTVKKGDTLWDIAGFYLNNPFLWPDIYELNRDKIENPHWIYPDQVFELPIPGEGRSTMISAKGRDMKFKKIKYTDLSKMYGKKGLSIDWLKAQRMIPEQKYLDIMHFPNNVSYKGLYYGGFVSDRKLEVGKITGKSDKTDLKSGSLPFDMIEINLGKGDVKIGQKFSVFEYGESVKSGKNSGKIVKIYGTIIVSDIFDKYSVCKIKDVNKPLTEGMLIMDYWQPYYVPDFNFTGVKENIKAKILEFCGAIGILKDYDYAYIDKGKSDGFTQGDKFDMIDEKGDLHGKIQLMWVGENFSSAYVTNICNIHSEKYTDLLLKLKALPEGEVIKEIIQEIPVIEEEVETPVVKETVEIEEEQPVIEEEVPVIEEDTTTIETKTIVEEEIPVVGDTVRADSNATVIMEIPASEKTEPVIEEESTEDTTSSIIVIEEEAPDTTGAVIIEEEAPDTTGTVIIEEEAPDTTGTIIIEEEE